MEKVLIIKPSSLGDILHALQVVETLRERRGRENVEITWIARDIFAPVLEACATVDRVIVFERKKGIRGIWELGMRLRRERFDLVLDMQGLARSAFWAICANAPRKIGRADGREFSKFCFRELAGTPPNGFKKTHAVEILSEFLPKLGLPKTLCGSVKFPGAKLSENVSAEMKKLPPAPPILLFPDSRRAEKEWPYFSELTRAILEKFPNANVAWIGQSALVPAQEYATNPRFANLMGKTRLPDVLALVANAKLCVTNDSGPMHIAAAAGVPVLGIFGPTPPLLYGPFPPERETNRTIRAPGGDLKKLPVSDVLAEIEKILA